MIDNIRHIIHRINLEVNVQTEKEAYALKNSISSFLDKELLPHLEVFLKKYDACNNIYRFEKIYLEIETNQIKKLDQIRITIIEQLAKKLSKQVPVDEQGDVFPGYSIKNDLSKNVTFPQQANVQTFLFFLEKGYLPWYGSEKLLTDFFESDNLKDDILKSEFKKLLSQNSNAFERMLLQCPDDFVIESIISISPGIISLRNKLKDSIQNAERILGYFFKRVFLFLSLNIDNEKILFSLYEDLLKIHSGNKDQKLQWEKIIKLLQNKIPGDLPIDKILQKIKLQNENILNELISEKGSGTEKLTLLKQKTITSKSKEDISSKLKKKQLKVSEEFIYEKKLNEITIPVRSLEKVSESLETSFLKDVSEKEKELFVNNAGLILLHPYLKHFFIETEIADVKGNILKSNLSLAVQALHFIATGHEDVYESGLVFEKFLCGISIDTPLLKESQLTDETKTEALKLLEEVIKNWQELKNVSPDWLRQMFLQRKGKLLQLETGNKLIIERKAQDILLDKLAWNISMIKIPWHSTLIFVEW